MLKKLIDFIYRDWSAFYAETPIMADGTTLTGWVMRKREKGTWLYRACTKEEAEDALCMWAIK